MNITRALTTIKHSRPVIEKDLKTFLFCGVFKNGVDINTSLPTKDFVETTRKNVQSLKDRFASEFDLRQKINAANNHEKVVVNGVEMTIADALTYRTHILPQQRSLLAYLEAAQIKARNEFRSHDREFENKLIRAGEDAEMRALLTARDKPEVQDIQPLIDELKKQIEFFDIEFDSLLSERNPLIQLD